MDSLLTVCQLPVLFGEHLNTTNMGRCPLSPYKHTQMWIMYAQMYMSGIKKTWVILLMGLQMPEIQTVPYKFKEKAEKLNTDH